MSFIRICGKTIFSCADENRSSCPPPISAQEAQQSSRVNSGFMSLQRTRQSTSTNSLGSSERKFDSSSGAVVRSNVASQKSMSRVFRSATGSLLWNAPGVLCFIHCECFSPVLV